MTWNANRTITYQQKRRWYFDPDNSNGTLKDNITTINVVALVCSSIKPVIHGYTREIKTDVRRISVAKSLNKLWQRNRMPENCMHQSQPTPIGSVSLKNCL
jgi:hypothetical protein